VVACFSSTRTRNYDFGNERIYAGSTWQIDSERDIVYWYMPVWIHVYICIHIYIYTHIYKVFVCAAIHILKDTYNAESGPPLCDPTLHTALALPFAVAVISSQTVEETRIILIFIDCTPCSLRALRTGEPRQGTRLCLTRPVYDRRLELNKALGSGKNLQPF